MGKAIMNIRQLFYMSGFFLLVISCLFGAVQSSAEELTADLTSLSIEELMNIRVVSASRYEQPVSEAPSSVTVVTADEIKRYGHRTLADILKSTRGFSVTYDRTYSYVGVRGYKNIGEWNSHILILVNGHRINENVYDSSMIGNDFLLDVDLIDRVEIIRGPGSSIYGDNAFFAVINVITRNGGDLKGTEVAAAAGSLNTYNGRMSYGKRFENGAEMLISGSVLDSQGNQRLYFREFDSLATNNGIAQNLDDEKNDRFFSRFVYGDFALEGAYGGRTKKIPTASYEAVFNDPRYESFDGRSYLDLTYNHSFKEDLKIQSRLFYDWYSYHSDTPNDDSGATVINKDIGKAQWWGAEAQVEKSIATTHRLLAGADYQRTPEVLLQNYDLTPYFLYCNIANNLEKWAVFLQDEFRLTSWFVLNAGIRYDHYNTFGGTINPRVGLNFTPREGTTIKLLYGNAFRAPNAYELYFDAPAQNLKPNPALKPERIRTVELVYEQYLMGKYLGTVSVFQNSITNPINSETDPSGDNVYKNIDGVTAKGIEVELERRIENGWGGKFSYTFTKTRDDITGEEIMSSPAHMAKLNLSFPVIRKNVFLGVETQYTSRREALTGQEVSDYIITNLTLFGKELARGLELSGSIYNVFDKKYGDPCSIEHVQGVIEQDGRGGRVKLVYRF